MTHSFDTGVVKKKKGKPLKYLRTDFGHYWAAFFSNIHICTIVTSPNELDIICKQTRVWLQQTKQGWCEWTPNQHKSVFANLSSDLCISNIVNSLHDSNTLGIFPSYSLLAVCVVMAVAEWDSDHTAGERHKESMMIPVQLQTQNPSVLPSHVTPENTNQRKKA